MRAGWVVVRESLLPVRKLTRLSEKKAQQDIEAWS
jgi:hypothetical protein